MSKLKLNLLTIIDAICKIENYSSEFNNAHDFYHGEKSFDACMMQFIVIGEAVSRLDENFKNSNPISANWVDIKNFRNLIAHNYFGIDADEVWEIINDYIPQLKIDIDKNILMTDV